MYKWLLGVFLLLGSVACTDGGSAPAIADAAVPSVGELQLSLAVPPGVALDTVEVEISGPGFHRVVQLSVVGDGKSLLATVSGVPSGVAYQVRVVAKPINAPNQLCTAVQPCDIGENLTTKLNVQVHCAEPLDGGGAEAAPVQSLDADTSALGQADAATNDDANALVDAWSAPAVGADGCAAGHVRRIVSVDRCNFYDVHCPQETACFDHDECQVNAGGCGELAACINLPGSHRCECLPGYAGDGITCSDVDECATDNGGCGADRCVNADGSYTCVSGAPRVVQLTAGGWYTCALASDGRVFCWGENAKGQLGDGTLVSRHTPAVVAGLGGVVSIASEWNHTCALLKMGTVRCWGDNSSGQLGGGRGETEPSPLPVRGMRGVKQVATGHTHTCVLLESGSVECWGGGLVGSGPVLAPSDVPATGGAPAPLLSDVVALASGSHHMCAIDTRGAAHCWGREYPHQLDDYSSLEWRPITVALERVAQVAPGSSSTCAVLVSGEARCWGSTYGGILGEGTHGGSDGSDVLTRPAPTPVTGLSDAVEIDMSAVHACARLSSGALRCWGNNWHGQLGDGTSDTHVTPHPVVGVDSAIDLAVGALHTCALLQSGEVRCWGNPSALGGQTWRVPTTVNVSLTADETRADAGTPGSEVDGGTPPMQTPDADECDDNRRACGELASCINLPGTYRCECLPGYSGDGHTCVDLDECANNNGGCGSDVCRNAEGSFACVGPSSNAVMQLAAGRSHVCALAADGRVFCWGDNHEGQLGDGTTTSRAAPALVSGLGGVRAIAAGWDHTCALLHTGTVRCWGSNYSWNLGNGSPPTYETRPTLVRWMRDVVQLAAGKDHSCALLGSGRIRCWGNNSAGEYGDGTWNTRLHPGDVSGPSHFDALVGLDGITGITAGNRHTCALHRDGGVLCWGSNSNGKLGINRDLREYFREPEEWFPRAVFGLHGATNISAGDEYTCATLASGEGRCWGSTADGVLGDGASGSPPHHLAPTAVLGLSGAVEIESEIQHTCARLSSGAVQCWGDNSFGQLGDGTREDRIAPTEVSGLRNVADVVLAAHHSCALLDSGEVRCWGRSLDNPNSADAAVRLTPTRVALPL